MSKVLPVSELNSYSAVLNQVLVKEPVILTKNGYGKYAIVDLDEFEEMKKELDKLKQENWLLQKLSQPYFDKARGKEGMTLDEFREKAGWTK